MLIDSHTHIEMSEFDADRDEVVERARQEGVGCMLCIGTSLESCEQAISLTRRYAGVYASVGVHPHDVKTMDRKTCGALEKMAAEEKVVACGEMGLDFYRNLSPRDLQIRYFGEQLELASALGLPVIIHDREAHREVVEMLTSLRGKVRGVIHCFSGDRNMAAKCLDLGFYISVPGTVTYEKAEELRRVVEYAPLSSLLVETDAPYLAPQPHRGKRNEPAYAALTARKLAEVKGISFTELARITTKNAIELFGFPGLSPETADDGSAATVADGEKGDKLP